MTKAKLLLLEDDPNLSKRDEDMRGVENFLIKNNYIHSSLIVYSCFAAT